MSSRKESLKKSLGITEYPWSSEDEEDTSSAQDVMQRTDQEPRPSVADMPGTSGVQPQEDPASPGTSRRIQARMDRDLFWSIINNTPRPTNNSNVQPSRSRATVPPMCPTTRPTPQRSRMDNNTEQRTRRPERQHTSVDVQRILAFKKLTRSLHNLAQSKAAASTPQRGSASSHTPPRGSRPHDRVGPTRPGPSQVPPRPSLFTPGFQMNTDRHNYIPPWRRPTFPRLSPGPLPGSNVPLVPPVYVPPTEPVEPWHFGPPLPTPPTTCDLPDLPTPCELPDLPTYSNIPSINDDGIAVPPSIIEKIEPPDEPNENPEEEIVEEPVHNETGSGARLIEEVVELPDAPEGNLPPPGTDHGEETPVAAAGNNTSGETANSDDNTGTPQDASYRGMKRKRHSTDESNELFSVQEFNQSLLRLLECPVCLEWMEPPISQCRRGHLVCSRCRARLAACPVCRTPFSSVRNRAMEGVAEMLRYPCRHGCGREVRLRRRAPHEASCGSRRYHCPAPPCARHPPLQRDELAHHFQCKHLPILKIGNKHKFSMKVNSEQHDTWLIMALDEYFHLRVDVDIRTWGVIVYVAYIGPKKNASHFTYEVTVEGQHNSRKLVYTRGTHSDLESSSLNVSRQDCFHLTLDQALNFLRFKNRHCEPDKFLDFDVEITKWESLDESKEDSES